LCFEFALLWQLRRMTSRALKVNQKLVGESAGAAGQAVRPSDPSRETPAAPKQRPGTGLAPMIDGRKIKAEETFRCPAVQRGFCREVINP
jgi:hypothetical protein